MIRMFWYLIKTGYVQFSLCKSLKMSCFWLHYYRRIVPYFIHSSLYYPHMIFTCIICTYSLFHMDKGVTYRLQLVISNELCVRLSTGTKDVNVFTFKSNLIFSVEICICYWFTAIYLLLDCYRRAYSVFVFFRGL